MRRKPLFLLTFLLMLYIAPMIFMPSYSHAAIPAEQNMNKDFVLSTEYDVSEQSITSFSETLPDDVLFFPDSILSNPQLATGGDTGYENTYVVDTVYFSVVMGDEILEFEFNTNSITQIEYFTYAVYGQSTDHTFLYYNDDGEAEWTNWFADIDTDLEWYNGTEYDMSTLEDIAVSGTFYIYFDHAANIDYVEISFSYMTLVSDYHYAESFQNVSSWEISESGVTDGAISTDGDIANVSCTFDNPENEYIYIYSAVSVAVTDAYRLELRLNFKDNKAVAGLRLYDGDDFYFVNTIAYQAGWWTYNIQLSELSKTGTPTTIDEVRIYFNDNPDTEASGGNYLELDYIRISPSDEMGWQSDCSTVASTTTLRADVETDSDHIRFQYSGGGGTGELSFHTDFGGSAIAAIDTDYYPFIGWNVVNLTSDFYEVYADNTLVYTGSGLGLQRVNVKASGEGEYTTITFVLHTVAESMALDWVKGYSIANYTYSGSGVGIDDYLYVSSGILYSNIDDGYIELNHDPALSVDTGLDGYWNLDTSTGTPQSDYYVDGAWVGWTSETEGSLEDAVTLTDLKLKFTDNANVAAVIFFIAPLQWREVGEAELIFVVPVDETGINMFLIFLGLIMIPFSTLYLVRGGRSDMSMDKFFYGIIAFMIGWALFLGGIFG